MKKKLIAGDWYRTRGGDKVQVEENPNRPCTFYPFRVVGSNCVLTEYGRYWATSFDLDGTIQDSPSDLVKHIVKKKKPAAETKPKKFECAVDVVWKQSVVVHPVSIPEFDWERLVGKKGLLVFFEK